MKRPSIRFTAAATAMFIACSSVSADEIASPTSSASEPRVKLSAERIKKLLDPYPNAVGPVLRSEATKLGELEWIDSDGDGRPDTLTLSGKVVVPPRTAENGSLFGLFWVSFDGELERTGGKERYTYKRLLITQSSLACQHILLDFTGPEVWVSPAFPEERQFPGAEKGCVDVTWVRWDRPYPFFYLGGPEYPLVFGYNAKLKAVIGPVDAPPHPRCQSLVPQPFGAIEECMATLRAEKKKAQAKPKTQQKSPS